MRTRRGERSADAASVAVGSSSETQESNEEVSSPIRPTKHSISSPVSSNGKKSASVSSPSIVTQQARSTRSNAQSSPKMPDNKNESHRTNGKVKCISNESTPEITSTERQESHLSRRHLQEAAKENDIAKTNGSATIDSKKKELPSRLSSRRIQGFHSNESLDEGTDGSIVTQSKNQGCSKDKATTSAARRSNRTAARKELSVAEKEEESTTPLPSMSKNVARAGNNAATVLATTVSLRKNGPNYLNEDTMQRVRDYVTGDHWKKDQVLDDDEVIELMERLYATAHQRALRRRIVGMDQTDDDTDQGVGGGIDDDDSSVFESLFMEEEAHRIGHEFFSDMVDTLSTTSEGSGAVVLDGKTLNWIKRAVGLRHRSSGTIALSQASNENSSVQYESSRRIATRRLGRESRAERLQDRKRGLDALSLAIGELEKDLDVKFPVYKARKIQKNARSAKDKDHPTRKKKLDQPIRTKKLDQPIRKKLDPDRAVKKSPQQRAVKRSTQLKTKEGKLPPKSRTNIKGASKTVKKKVGTAKRCAKETLCTSLRVLDRTWHRLIAQRYPHAIPTPNSIAASLETASQFRVRQAIPLHPRFARAGIIHRLPLVHTLAQHDNATSSLEVDEILALRTYNMHCHQLWNCLRGLSRRFAQFEFFYSDLDTAWYKENVVAKLLGFSEDTPLSHSEWKRIRRLRKVVPRRFSKHFIISQLQERNDYRSKVRKIQSNPSTLTDFPYNVYMPNRIGSMVTAYCKRYHVLQRGSVLAYFPDKAVYLIEFENVHFGCEYCPDSDVASCDVPTRVIPSKCIPRQRKQVVSHFEQGTVWLNKLAQNPFSAFTVSETIAQPTSSSLKTFVDEVANYDSFLTLLETMDVARRRKHEILSLVADANTLAITALPFGQSDEAFRSNATTVESIKLSHSTKDHLRWLINSLQRTNLVLDASMSTFRTLFGDSFVPNEAFRSSNIDTAERIRLMKKAEAVLTGS